MKSQKYAQFSAIIFHFFVNLKQLDVESVKKFVDAVVPLITTLGFIIGGLYTLVAYNNQQQTRREDKALELYMKQVDDSLLKSSRKLDIFYNTHKRDQMLKVLENKKDFETQYHQFIVNFSQEKDTYEDIQIMTNYYEGIANCVKTKLCDANAVNNLFKKDGREFFQTFYPIFCEIRHKFKDDTIGLELEKFYNPNTIEQKFDPKTASLVSESRVCDYLKNTKLASNNKPR